MNDEQAKFYREKLLPIAWQTVEVIEDAELATMMRQLIAYIDYLEGKRGDAN